MTFEIILMAFVTALVIAVWVFSDLDKGEEEHQPWADPEVEEALK